MLILRLVHARAPFQPVTARKALRFRSGFVFCLPLLLAGCSGDFSALDPAGPFAAAIADLWWLMLGGATVIFLLVLALFLVVLFRPGTGAAVPASRWIWLGGIILPLATLVALVGHGLMRGEYLLKGEDGTEMMEIEARGRMWEWEFRYGDGTRASRGILHIPAGRTIHVTATSEDVIHSFWVPRLGGKIDATPGHAATVRIMADKPGVYGGLCSEYCGTGHSGMRFVVHAHPPEVFETLLQELSGEPEETQ